jgi:hypothetical protein
MKCKAGELNGCNGTCCGNSAPAVRISGSARPRAWPIYLAGHLAESGNLSKHGDCVKVGAADLTFSADLLGGNPELLDAIARDARTMGLRVDFIDDGSKHERGYN